MIHYCGRGSMVELELPAYNAGSTFPSPAPWNRSQGHVPWLFLFMKT